MAWAGMIFRLLTTSLTKFGPYFTAMRAYQILTHPPDVALSIPWKYLRVGCCPVYIVPHMSPVGRNNGNIFFFLICSREHLSFIEQKTQLFYEGIFTLLRECIKHLMMSKAHCFHMPAVLLWSERSAGTFLQRLLERARFQTRIYRHKSIVF